MNRLKIILQFDSSKFIHVGISISLFVLSEASYLAIFLFVIHLLFLFKVSKNLLVYSLIICGVVFLRMQLINQEKSITSGIVVGKEEKHLVIKNGGLYYLYISEIEDYDLGMSLEFFSKRYTPEYRNIPGTFDHQTYLKGNNVRGQLTGIDVKVVKHSFVIESIPKKIKDFIDDNYNEVSASYLKLFVLGDRSNLDSEVYYQANKLGISHLFAISGMHLGIIVGFVNLLINKFLISKKTHGLIIGGFLVLYNIITGFSISIIRASLLSMTVFLGGRSLFSKTDFLSFIMIGFMLWNPYILYNTGFILSFLISFSIILGQKLWLNDKKGVAVFKIGILATSVSLPIVLNLNGSFGLMNLIYNTFFVFFVGYLLLPMTFGLLAVKGLEPIFAVVANGFEVLVEFSYRANYYFEFQFGNNTLKVLYWGLLLFYLVEKGTRKRVKYLIGIFLVLIINPLVNYIPNLTYIRVLDVNQGDAIHLHDQGCNILIDTGISDKYDTVINYFNMNNIQVIDYLFITHWHADHYGEANDIFSALDVRNVVVNQRNPDLLNTSQIEMKYHDIIRCEGISLININSTRSNNENNNSLVLYTEIGNDAWLFAGDIEKAVEEELVNNYYFNLTVLKVAHHGSITSSTDAFISQFSPNYAIISVGVNSYNHPHPDIIDRLRSNNVRVFRTDEQGTITFYYDKITGVSIIETYILGKRPKYLIKN